MSKGKNFESLKIPFVKTCPICGEKYYKRVTKKGKTKGLDLNFVSKETPIILNFNNFCLFTKNTFGFMIYKLDVQLSAVAN